MADIYLHARLAEEVMKDIDISLKKDLVYLGAQGPDPLYYQATGDNAKDYKYLADRIHDTDTQTFLIEMTNYLKENYSEMLFSHYLGFICHYALDVKIHPYVYYNVGIYRKDKPETNEYKGLHFKFERSIDACMIEKEQKMKANKFKVHKAYFNHVEIPLDILFMIETAVNKTFDKNSAGTMYEIGAKKMFKNIKSFVYDPFGIKKQVLKVASLFMKTELEMPDLSFFNHIENYDFLNESKKTWYHPLSNIPSNSSVEELFNEAKVFAHEIIKNVREYLLDSEKVDLKTVFTNLSFNSGMNCDLKEEMKYFNNYRK